MIKNNHFLLIRKKCVRQNGMLSQVFFKDFAM